ncbi:transmembrane anchor protein, partial [Pseudomonas aeruginosa]|nr:transmembrane anchor protein [Pseudomonas aeruginosa]
CFMGKLGEVKSGDFAKSGSLFQTFPSEGGVVNFDTHGDGGGQSISYEKGRAVPASDGVIQAAFNGNHGWFWRNRGDADVTVIVRTRGQYAEMKRVL